VPPDLLSAVAGSAGFGPRSSAAGRVDRFLSSSRALSKSILDGGLTSAGRCETWSLTFFSFIFLSSAGVTPALSLFGLVQRLVILDERSQPAGGILSRKVGLPVATETDPQGLLWRGIDLHEQEPLAFC
jgi:hypothetical protein